MMYHNQRPLVDALHQAHLDQQDVDWEKIIYSGIPWLPLDLDPPNLDQVALAKDVERWFYHNDVNKETLQSAAFIDSNIVGDSMSQRLDNEPNQRLWQGKMLFGPKDWIKETYTGTIYVEYTMARRFRNRMDCAWDIDSDHPIRKFVSSLVSDQDLYSVSVFLLPPTEYLDPHLDYNQGLKIGLASIFWGAQWDPGNDFGLAGFGLAPIKQDWVGLIDTFNHPHWVINRSQRDRINIVINLEHSAISKVIENSWRKIWR